MYLKVIGNPEKAAKAMQTKAILSKGQVLSGDEKTFKELAEEYPELFTCFEAKGNDMGLLKPGKNKLMRPDSSFKTT